MIKGITEEDHFITDYGYVPLVMAAPELVGFSENKQAATVCRAMAATVLAYTLITDMKQTPIKILPYKTHAALDFATGVAALALPWVAKFSGHKQARNTLLAMGITGLVVGTLSWIGARKI